MICRISSLPLENDGHPGGISTEWGNSKVPLYAFISNALSPLPRRQRALNNRPTAAAIASVAPSLRTEDGAPRRRSVARTDRAAAAIRRSNHSPCALENDHFTLKIPLEGSIYPEF